MVDNVGDRVMWSEKEVNLQNKKNINTFLAVTTNVTRDQYEQVHVAAVPRNLFSFFTMPRDKKVWESLL